MKEREEEATVSIEAGVLEMAGEGRGDWQLEEIKTDKQKGERKGGKENGKTEIESDEGGKAAGLDR